MKAEHCQNLIIGSGEAGKYLAWTLAARGQKTLVVERSMIGGSCPNVACLPSKNVIFSAKAVALANPATGLGVVTGQTGVDMAGVVRRKRQMVDELVKRHLDHYKSSGADLVMGEARFVDEKTIDVALTSGGVRRFSGERVVINVGSRATVHDVPGMAAAMPMTHVEALDLERLPDHLVVIGGGYVGLEFAQAMRRFGSRVTVLQRGRRLLEREDPDVAAGLLEVMRDEGVEVLLQAEIVGIQGRSGTGVKIEARVAGGISTIEASDLLAAAGRTPNTDRLDVGKTNVRLDARGYIQVNERLQTSARDIWAVGDCAGSPQFTHVGFDDFRVVLDNLDGGSRTTFGRVIPFCLFTEPELARIGINETEAKANNVSYRLARLPMSSVLRAITLSETRGFLKALIGADDRILGFTALGIEASEMMAVVQTAMLGGLPYTALRDAIFTHPTAAEGLNSLFANPPALPNAR